MLALAAILALSLAHALPTAPLPPQPFTVELLDLKRGDWRIISSRVGGVGEIQGKSRNSIQRRRAWICRGRFICRRATVARPTGVKPTICAVSTSARKCSDQTSLRG
jgi:hypothetical protein